MESHARERASDQSAVVSVKVQAKCRIRRRVVALASELVARRRGPGAEARSSPRMIAQFRHFATGAARGEGCGSQVVAGQVEGRVAVYTHCHPAYSTHYVTIHTIVAITINKSTTIPMIAFHRTTRRILLGS